MAKKQGFTKGFKGMRLDAPATQEETPQAQPQPTPVAPPQPEQTPPPVVETPVYSAQPPQVQQPAPDPRKRHLTDSRYTSKGEIRYTFLFRPDLLDQVKQMADVKDLKIKDVLNEAIADYLAKHWGPRQQARAKEISMHIQQLKREMREEFE